MNSDAFFYIAMSEWDFPTCEITSLLLTLPQKAVDSCEARGVFVGWGGFACSGDDYSRDQ